MRHVVETDDGGKSECGLFSVASDSVLLEAPRFA